MAFLVLGGLALAAIAMFLVIAVAGAVMHVAVRLVLLPLLLLKFAVAGIVMLVVGPLVLVIGIVAFVATALALAVPLLPLLVLAAIAWLIVRANRRPVAA
jgi:hypothetical protein